MYGPSTSEDRCDAKGPEGTRQTAKRRCAAGSGCPAHTGAPAIGQGASAPRISQVVPLTSQAIRTIAHRYQRGGLESALFEKQRPGAVAVLDDAQQQRIIAMTCSNPPEGRARWTVRLVAQEAVKRRLVPRVGREAIRIILLDHDLKPWRGKNVVVRRDKPAWSRG